MREPKEPHQPAEEVSSERTLWYVQTLFAYTNQLMERTQLRCNYLILANSVAVITFLTITNALLSNRGKTEHLISKSDILLVALLPAAIFMCSLVTSVRAFLPRIYDAKIELNHGFIATMDISEYRRFLLDKPDEGKLGDVVDEIHVLCRILNDRTRLVDSAARLFILAVVAMLAVIACAVL